LISIFCNPFVFLLTIYKKEGCGGETEMMMQGLLQQQGMKIER
jgi:hypothetical protein